MLSERCSIKCINTKVTIYFLKVASYLRLNDAGYSMIETPLFRSGYAAFLCGKAVKASY